MYYTTQISVENWIELKEKLLETYPFSVVISSSKRKHTFGFTLRLSSIYEHESVCLDFEDEKIQFMFLLKYSEIITPIVKKKEKLYS